MEDDYCEYEEEAGNRRNRKDDTPPWDEEELEADGEEKEDRE
ncbi:MAG: hypothetical protein ACLT76_18055 [Clostridium fessum]